MTDDKLDILHSFNERLRNMPTRRGELIREAREAGYTWRAIADSMGMTEHGAIKAAQRGLVNSDGNE